MGRPKSPLDIFERVMKAGHEPSKLRVEIKATYNWKPLSENPDIKSVTVR